MKNEVPAAFVEMSYVITVNQSMGTLGVTATYGFRSDDESDDPRLNLSLPFGLKACRT